jgi:excisionase family DNA binding protein
MDCFLTTSQAARVLGVKESTMADAIRTGKVSVPKVMGRYCWTREAIVTVAGVRGIDLTNVELPRLPTPEQRRMIGLPELG